MIEFVLTIGVSIALCCMMETTNFEHQKIYGAFAFMFLGTVVVKLAVRFYMHYWGV